MISMDVDTALSEVPVNLVPLTDDTDFKSIEESVAYNASGLELIWHFVTSAGAYTATVVTPTTAGVYDWTHQDGGMYTIEIPASGGGSINNDTEGYGWFTGKATGVLPWRGPTICFRAAAINDALCDGGDNLDVNAVQAGGQTITAAAGITINAEVGASATAMNNFEDAYDGTGYDLGGLDVSEVNAIMDDLLNGGRLDLIIDAIKTVTDNLPDSGALTTLTGYVDSLETRLTAARAGYLDNLNGHTPQTGDTFAQLPTNFSDLSITLTTGRVDVASIEGVDATDQINAACDTAFTDYDPPTKAELDTGLAGLNDPTAAAIADQVWDEVLSGHLTAGSTGASLNAAGSAGDPWTTSLPGSYTGTQAGKILADILDDVTGLNGDAMRGTDSAFLAASAPTNFSALGINVSGHLSRVTLVDTTTSNTDMRGTDSAYTGTPPTAAAITDAVLDEALSGHTTAGTLGKAVSDILADTNELQSDDVPGLIAALNDLDAAGVRTAVGLASANLDTQLGTIDSEVGVIDGIVDSILANQISGVALTSSERDSVAAAILDLSNGVEVGHTVKQALRLSSSALGGKVSGMDSNSPVFRNPGDTADRITATTDADGNRSAVVLNL